jgi:ABC-type microcin C transport system permease subunit YejE
MFGTLYFFGLVGLVMGIIGDLIYTGRRSAHRLRGAPAHDANQPPPHCRVPRQQGAAWPRWSCSACCSACRCSPSCLANDRPLLIRYDGAVLFAGLPRLSGNYLRGDLPTTAVYTDVEVVHLIEAKGWILWPAIPTATTRGRSAGERNALLPPSLKHPLGTDDQARDVLARVIYVFASRCCSASP